MGEFFYVIFIFFRLRAGGMVVAELAFLERRLRTDNLARRLFVNFRETSLVRSLKEMRHQSVCVEV